MVGIKPPRLVPENECRRPRPVHLFVRPPRMCIRPDDPATGVSKSCHRLPYRQVSDDGDAKDCSGRRPHRLGVKRIDRPAGEHHSCGPRSHGGPKERPGVARIAHVCEDDDQAGGGRDGAEVDVNTPHHGDDALRSGGVGQSLDHSARDMYDGDSSVRGGRLDLGSSGGIGVKEHLGNLGRGAESLEHHALPLHPKRVRLVPARSPGQLARGEHARVLKARDLPFYLVLSSDFLATSASAAKALGSLTASSASIFRSTSTSATRSPAMKRL
jgi:hypothetical protein